MSAAVQSQVSARKWAIDSVHSSAQFKVRHMMISNIKGEFTSLTGSLELNDDEITKSQVEAFIDVSSISTRDRHRDAHLKSADFFEAEKFPVLTFKSSCIARNADGDLAVEGDLTIHGVTRVVVLAVEGPSASQSDAWGKTHSGFSATTKINRKDFGLMWNAALETGGILLSNEVTITLDVEFVR
jgi:polyisoprenoid-binding protein YceI